MIIKASTIWDTPEKMNNGLERACIFMAKNWKKFVKDEMVLIKLFFFQGITASIILVYILQH